MIKLFKNKRLNFAVSCLLIVVCCLTFSTAPAYNQTKKRSGEKIIAVENLTPVVLIHGIGASELRRVMPEKERAKKET